MAKIFFTEIDGLFLATQVKPKTIHRDSDNPQLWDVRGNIVYRMAGHNFSSIAYGEGASKEDAQRDLESIVGDQSFIGKIKAFFKKAC